MGFGIVQELPLRLSKQLYQMLMISSWIGRGGWANPEDEKVGQGRQEEDEQGVPEGLPRRGR